MCRGVIRSFRQVFACGGTQHGAPRLALGRDHVLGEDSSLAGIFAERDVAYRLPRAPTRGLGRCLR